MYQAQANGWHRAAAPCHQQLAARCLPGTSLPVAAHGAAGGSLIAATAAAVRGDAGIVERIVAAIAVSPAHHTPGAAAILRAAGLAEAAARGDAGGRQAGRGPP